MRRSGSLVTIATGCLMFLSSCGGSSPPDVTVSAPPPQPAASPSPSPSPQITTVALKSPIAILERPTDPETRVKTVKGRPDPFVTVEPAPAPPKPVATTNASKPVLPPLPEPEQARAVQVSGIMVVGGVVQAIVKAPNENTVRTVTVGDVLSNGLVTVRAIEVNRPDPVVILEQYGRTVEIPIYSPQPGAAA